MLWSKIQKKWFLVIGLIGGCGFTPFLESDNANHPVLGSGNYEIETSSDDIGFRIKEELLKALSFPSFPEYKILVINTVDQTEGIVTKNNEITRYGVTLNSTFKLISNQNGMILLDKPLTSQTSFSASKNVTGFATDTAEKSAADRLARDVAEKITVELLLAQKEF